MTELVLGGQFCAVLFLAFMYLICCISLSCWGGELTNSLLILVNNGNLPAQGTIRTC